MSTTTAPRRRNLADTFASTPPDRSAGLTDLLPPRPASPTGSGPAPETVPLQRRDTASSAAPAQDAPSPTTAQDTEPPAPDLHDAPPPETTTSTGTGEQQASEERTLDALQTQTTSDGTSATYERPVVTAAVVADDVVRSVAVYLPPALVERLRRSARSQNLTYADLLVRAAHTHLDQVAAPPAPPASTPHGAMPKRLAQRRGSGGVQTQLRLDGHQVAWLDATVTRLRFPSRTALVLALLEAALPFAGKRS